MNFLRKMTMLALVGAIVPLSSAFASDLGMVAANQVSKASYMDFMDTWLFTHDGDDRGPYGPELIAARDNIAALMTSYGLSVELEPFTYSGTVYHNVVGTKVGTLYPDQEYIVGSHYDSVSNPGADDNASGTALVLEAARVLGQYPSEYTIRFVAFSMEEVGLVGSYNYVSDHITDDILGMISADMVAYNTGANSANIYADPASAPIKSALGAAVEEYGDGMAWNDAGTSGASNHAPFEDAGFVACLLIEDWGNPYYHTAQDSFDTPGYLDYDYAVRMARSVVGYLVDHAGVMVDADILTFDYPDGHPEYVDPAGGDTMLVEVNALGDAVPQPDTGVFYYDDGSGWMSVPMEMVGAHLYEAVFPATDCPGEISYYFSAEDTTGAVFSDPYAAPDVYYTALVGFGMTEFYSEPLDADPGWPMTGEWEFGQPTGQGGYDHGNPDPNSGATGNNVFGINLQGDYSADIGGPYYLTTGPFDCSGKEQVELQYQRWLNTDYQTYVYATVEVSNNGSTWNPVWDNGTSEIADNEWIQQSFDISATADGEPMVYIRWGHEVASSGAYAYSGWNIDDLQFIAIDCGAPCPADITGDMVVDVLDLLEVLSQWGTSGSADITGDGVVDVLDLLEVLSAWGPC